MTRRVAKRGRKRDERLPNGSTIYWSRRFEDGQYASGETRWRVPIHCGQCGQVREVNTSAARRPKFTGLCSICAQIERTEDEELENGSIVYWSRRFKDGRYPGGRIHWRIPVRCGKCGQVRRVCTSTAQSQGFTGLCQSCTRVERTEDEEL
ncbi:MAG: hypothetical protein ISS49_00475 [Anaerolineae bacterium]|nr:hypothetical protein [Anaerolineae bacterium]